jgi:ADP-dependent NAD(P)H-hydrate dehydratase / NAD(P)H-hydrate epimerase
MIVLIGTVPYATGLYCGEATIDGARLRVGEALFPIERGSAAMAAACVKVCEYYALKKPQCIFGGDTGDGKGTDLMFQEAIGKLDRYYPTVITLHYLFPKIVYGLPLVRKIKTLREKPQLIADAGGMYLMKVVKEASYFDVFTPDEGELYFLADEFAPHPLYVRSQLVKEQISRDELIGRAYRGKNTATVTLIKGSTDTIYSNGVKQQELSAPNMAAMEAIGGTGDTITGMLTALRFKGEADADFKALRLNRMIGKMIGCNAATQINAFIAAIPQALKEYEKNI